MHSVGVGISEHAAHEVSPLRFLNLVLRHWRAITWLPVLLAIGGGLGAWLRGAEYSARSSFVPQVPQEAASSLAGLAAQLGVAVGGASGGQSIEFYAELLGSEELLRQAVLSTYRFAVAEGSPDTLGGSLVTLYEVDGETADERTLHAVDELADRVSVGRNPKASLVTLSTTAKWPALAVQVNRRLLQLVNEFNLRKRQTQAAQEREFVGRRMEEARRELHDAEHELEVFLQRNRRFQDSPQLAFEVARLQRRVDLRQHVHLSLAQAFEQARIEEVRNTPVITLVDQPEGSVRSTGGVLRAAVTGLFVGLLMAAAWVFGVEYMARERRDDPDAYAQFELFRKQAYSRLAPRRLLRSILERPTN